MQERLRETLLASARLREADERVPFGFERRILAALARPSVVDPWLACSRVFWRAAVLGLAITLLSGGWAYYLNRANPDAVDLEHTLLATVEHPGEVW